MKKPAAAGFSMLLTVRHALYYGGLPSAHVSIAHARALAAAFCLSNAPMTIVFVYPSTVAVTVTVLVDPLPATDATHESVPTGTVPPVYEAFSFSRCKA